MREIKWVEWEWVEELEVLQIEHIAFCKSQEYNIMCWTSKLSVFGGTPLFILTFNVYTDIFFLALIILGVGSFISLLVFILELIIYKCF